MGTWLRTHRFAAYLGLITMASFAWRCFYLVNWKKGDDNLVDEGDAFYYSAQAVANAAGDFFRHPFTGEQAADHPPLTALLLTPVSWLSDSHVVFLQRFTMLLIGTAAVAVIGLVGRRLAGDRVGLLAAALAGVYAALWMNDALLMAEAPAALLTAVILLIALDLGERPTIAGAVVFGAVVGLATLTRAELALLLVLVGIPAFRRGGARGIDLVGRLAAAGLAAGVVLLPWVGWNMSRFEEPTFLSTNDGLTVLGANCDTTYFTPAIGFWSLQCALASPQEGDQSQVSQAWRDEGLEFMADNLDRVPAVVAARVGRLWGVYEPRQMVFFNGGEGRETWASWTGLYQGWLLVPLAIAGGVLLHRRRQPVAIFVGPIVAVTLTAALFYGIVRFRVPADVSMVVLGAVTLDGAITWFTTRRRPPMDPVGADHGGTVVGSGHAA